MGKLFRKDRRRSRREFRKHSGELEALALQKDNAKLQRLKSESPHVDSYKVIKKAPKIFGAFVLKNVMR
jgi:hypothetical protein